MFLDFISQNWISIFSVFIGVIVSFVFYKKSLSKASPVYFYTSNTVIKVNEQTQKDNISVFYKEKEISKLTKTHVVFWNAGNKTIEGRDIVDKEKLRIEFPKENGAVLSAQVVKCSRDVNGFIVLHETENNIVFIDFDFLDKNDGAVIEILHTFPTNSFNMQGIIKGIPEGIKNCGILMEPYIFDAFTEMFSPIFGKGTVIRFLYKIMFSKISLVLFIVIGAFYLYAAYDTSLIPEWTTEARDMSSRVLNLVFGLLFIVPTIFIYIFRNRKKIPKNLILHNYE